MRSIENMYVQILKLSLFGFGILTLALVTPSARAAVFQDRSLSSATQNIDRLSKLDFNDRNNSRVEVYVGDPEKNRKHSQKAADKDRQDGASVDRAIAIIQNISN